MQKKIPLPLLLHSLFNEMQWDSTTHRLINSSDILEKIWRNQKIDSSLMENITLKERIYNKSNNDIASSLQFGVGDISLCGILHPFSDEENLKFLKDDFFPQLTESILWSVLFNIQQIIDSLRLDISTRITEDNWYYHKSDNTRYMISKPYFYHAVSDCMRGGYKANLLWNLLHATSRSPVGGLESVSYFDIVSIKGQYQIIIPNSQFTYSDVIRALSSAKCIDRIYRYYKRRISKKKISTAILFLINLWNDLLEISDCYEHKSTTIRFTEENIIYDKTFSNYKWNDPEKFMTYEKCNFINMDFSDQTIQSDFIFCTFDHCKFTNMQLENFYENVHFPIIQCTFVSCADIPKEPAFQERIKNCSMVYE